MYVLVCWNNDLSPWYQYDESLVRVIDFLYDEYFGINKAVCGPHIVLWAGGVW